MQPVKSIVHVVLVSVSSPCGCFGNVYHGHFNLLVNVGYTNHNGVAVLVSLILVSHLALMWGLKAV